MRFPEIKSFRDRDQVLVGIVGLFLVGLLIGGSILVSTSGIFDDRYQLSAVFDRTGGLESGADVRVAGVAVGRVTSVDADHELGQVVVAFEVDRGVRLGPETTAEIAAATLLGGHYLRLDGPVVEPYLGDLPEDDERRRIPLDRTQGPTSLNRVLADTTDTVSAIDFEAANEVLGQLAGAAERNVDVLPQLIDDFTVISTAIAARDSELRRLTDSAGQLTATLAARDAELAALVEGSGRLLQQLAARRDELSTLLGDGSSAVQEVSGVLVQHRDAIDAAIANVDVITSRLAGTLPDLNQVLTQSRLLFPLLSATLDPAGGFSIRGEGIIVHPGQAENILDVVDDLLGALGVRP
jgi:phospholipid/cholesterol/gamma-HCH transport system substrate-binding protein